MSDERDIPRDAAGVPSPDVPMTPPDNTMDDDFASYDLDGYVLGALADDEAAQVRAAAQGNSRLAEEIERRHEIITQLAFAAPVHHINRGRSAGIRSRLVSRAVSSREGHVPVSRRTADLLRPLLRRDPSPRDTTARGGTRDEARSGATTSTAASTTTSTTTSFTAPLDSTSALQLRAVRRNYRLALGVLAAAATVVIAWQQSRIAGAGNAVRSVFATREQATARRLDSLLVASAHKDSVIASFAGPNMKVIDLINYSSQSPLARMFWEQKTAQWTMYAYHMRQPKPGKTFQVWLVTKTAPAPISAGTFTPNPDGSYVMHAKYALDANALVKVAVSEEPTGGVPAPTGPIIIAGAER